MNTRLNTHFCHLVVLLALWLTAPLAQAATVNATYNSATDIPVTASGYTATGNTVNFTLNYAPVVGTELTVVKNTALPFISGTFSNLAQGQAVTLSFGGTSYYFVADYFGGDGNDLVLVWADNRLFTWGKNDGGQVGNGTNGFTNYMPTAVAQTPALDGKTCLQLAGGRQNSLALCSDGTLLDWGHNLYLTTPQVFQTADTALAGKRVVKIATGDAHSLALCSDGTLTAWGFNPFGQVGDGTVISRGTPVKVVDSGALAGRVVVSVAAGAYHSLALCSDGAVLAWGRNDYGQLGDGTMVHRDTPVLVSASPALFGKTVSAISAGEFHSLALCTDGTLVAWGDNSGGQLGNGTSNSSTNGVAVTRTGVLSAKTVTAITSGAKHNLVLCSDGTIAAWGANIAGEVGDGNGFPGARMSPVAVTLASALGGRTVVSIAAGRNHSLAVCSDGSLCGWGYNADRQLGLGDYVLPKGVPTLVGTAMLPPGGRFGRIFAGPMAQHSLALVDVPPSPHITVFTGTSTAPADELQNASGTYEIPLATVGGSGAAQTFTIQNSSLARVDLNGLTVFSDNPGEFVVSAPAVTTLAPGASTTFTVTFTPMAVGQRSTAIHIGSNDADESNFVINVFATGNAVAVNATYTTGTEVPLTIAGQTITGNTVNFTLNYTPVPGTELMVVKNTGQSFIQGAFDGLTHGQLVPLSFGGTIYHFVTDYFGGDGNDLVLTWAGSRAFTWGYNFNGQLGDGTKVSRKVPTPMIATSALTGRTVVAIALGQTHTLTLSEDGSVTASGYNIAGQLGDGNGSSVTPFGSSVVPVPITTVGTPLAGRTVVDVAVGTMHSLALCSDGTLAAWGSNDFGQLGEGSGTLKKVPVAVTTTGTALNGRLVTDIATGSAHNLVLCADGTLVSWGMNDFGQLGDGTVTNRNLPTVVTMAGSALAGKTVVEIAAGRFHNLVRCADGTLATWGDNTEGQLGDGTTTQRNTPVAVSTAGTPLAGRTVVAIAAGGFHNLVLCSDGTLAAWGLNDFGQVGDATTTRRTSPVLVTTAGSSLAGKVVDSIAVGASHSLTLCTDGTLAAWGANAYGQLGDDSQTPHSVAATVSPVMLESGARFSRIFSGSTTFHSATTVGVPPAPEIAVFNGASTAAGQERQSNVGSFGFSNLMVGDSSAAQTFTIQNQGSVNLTSLVVTRAGAEAGDFALGALGTTTLTPGASTAFSVTFSPSAAGPRNAVVQIASNDANENLFLINITGTGEANHLDAAYNSAVDVPLTSNGFKATGRTVNFTLNYAPAVGAELMVVKNTGLNFINGKFSNLTQGQAVPLSFGGVAYDFVANYYGGSGNDLVLAWANTRAAAWGSNYAGQLGDASTSDRLTPGVVTTNGVLAGRTVIALTGGYSHSLALCSDGTLAAWGGNLFGQLGDGTTTSRFAPVAVNMTGVLSGKTVVAIGAGGYHNLVLCSDGTLAAWGYNAEGQLGDGTTTNRFTPVAVNMTGVLSGKTVVAISAGGGHNMALCSDGTLATWGSNQDGEIGDNTTTNRNTPVVVNTMGALSGNTVTAIAAGGLHSVALCSDGLLVEWGKRYTSMYSEYQLVPTAVGIPSGSALLGKTVVSVAAGGGHRLALCSDGTLAAWGAGYGGQLGDGSNDSIGNPIAVIPGALAGKTVVAIAAGFAQSFALCSDGTLAAWGENAAGQLGDNTLVSRYSPIAVSRGMLPLSARFLRPANGTGYHTLALVASAPSPEIAVFNGVSTLPADERESEIGGVTFYNTIGGPASSPQTFTIKNTGGAPLTGLALTKLGTDEGQFSLGALGATSLAPGATTTFTVTYSAAATGIRTALVWITSNEPVFEIFLFGRENNHPVAVTDVIERAANKGTKVSVAKLLLNDTDAEADVLSLTSVQAATPAGAGVTHDGMWVYYTPPVGSSAAGSFSYTISDGHGGSATGSVTVDIQGASNAATQNRVDFQIEPSGGGDRARVTFRGIPGRSYTVQYTDTMSPQNWQNLTTVTANAQGVYEVVDPPPLPPSRFYRSVAP